MINERDYAKIIARNLRELMHERQKSQADVARDLGINKATLSSWMNGTRTPKMAKIDMLCDYFDVSRSVLMEIHAPRTNADTTKEQAELIQRVMQADPDTVRLTLDILKRIDKK